MITLGIDLSTDRRKTAACRLRWDARRAVVERVDVGLDDEGLVARLVGVGEHEVPDHAALNVPFGWPRAFVDAVSGWRSGACWPGPDRRPMQLRRTDAHAQAALGRRPLSVSTDRVASTAMRAAHVLGEVAERRRLAGPIDRASGADGVWEAFPAGALQRWSTEDAPLRPTGHKDAGAEACEALLEALGAAAPWLELGLDGPAAGAARDALVASDDALDALVCALVARAAALGRTDPPPADEDGAAQVRAEGWIQLPTAGSLAGLASVGA